ncbi:MAG: hypothetical protein ABJF23_20775 [Bryobacteraceae bacterium]
MPESLRDARRLPPRFPGLCATLLRRLGWKNARIATAEQVWNLLERLPAHDRVIFSPEPRSGTHLANDGGVPQTGADFWIDT